MSKHTKKQLSVGGKGAENWIKREDGRCLIKVDLVSLDYTGGSIDHHLEHSEYMRLFAASPEMYELLKRMANLGDLRDQIDIISKSTKLLAKIDGVK